MDNSRDDTRRLTGDAGRQERTGPGRNRRRTLAAAGAVVAATALLAACGQTSRLVPTPSSTTTIPVGPSGSSGAG